ncbi:MAG TPA: hypothetical protein VGL42_04075 [Opitutaceae bacterium]|jgi:hypothetical protein
MTIVELKRLITHGGFYPVSIVLNSEDRTKNPRFEGDLNDFWQAAKALGAKAVFIQTARLTESDFQQQRPGSNDKVALENHLPRLSDFRKHIGREAAFLLSARSASSNLDFLIQEDWWIEFHKTADEAMANAIGKGGPEITG